MPSDRNELGEGQSTGVAEGHPSYADAQVNPEEGHSSIANDGQSGDADLGPLISAVRYWHRRRCFAMDQRKRADLALGSFLRTALGWTKALPDADRKRINGQADGLIGLGEDEAKAMSKGKPFETDEPAYDEWRDVILAALAARAPWDAVEKRATKEMGDLARTLPVYEWAKAIRGFGDVSLAIIVAEAGDLSAYPKKGHLWKRMGVAVMGDVRQGGLSKSASKELWIAHGYNRQRRSRMWGIGDSLVKGGEHYRQVFLARCKYEYERAVADGREVVSDKPSVIETWAKRGLPVALVSAKKQDRTKHCSAGHLHKRSQRYMEKRLLRDLWQEWRRGQGAFAERPAEGCPADEHKRAA